MTDELVREAIEAEGHARTSTILSTPARYGIQRYAIDVRTACGLG